MNCNNIISEYVQVEQAAQGLTPSRQFDISQIDFDLLRREFARAKKKNLVMKDLQELIQVRPSSFPNPPYQWLALLLLVGLLTGMTIAFPEIQNYKTRKEVFAYVTKNQDTIEIKDRTKRQQFPYAEWGFGDAGVMYGYIYDPNPNYETVGQKYHGGYRIDGATTYGDGWFYYQKICENWYYYEEHYG